jgi:hypothetical protein
MKTLALLILFVGSVALADDFKTIDGKEYKNVTVSKQEPDGITVTNKKAGIIVKLYFTELPKQIQERFHYDAAKAAHTDNAPPAEQPSPPEERSPAVIREIPQTPSQLDAAQFDDLRRRDWYEDLKAQEKLKNHADYMLLLMDRWEKEHSDCSACSSMFFEMLAAERKAHRDNYRALSSIAAKLAATKSYDDYKKLKTIENQVVVAIETQKIRDQTDAVKLQREKGEFEAFMLKTAQHFEKVGRVR